MRTPAPSRARHPAGHRGELGFTLVELLVAVAIVVIGLIGLFATLLAASRGNSIADATAQAVAIAEQRLERLRTLDTPVLRALPPAERTPPPVQVLPVLTAAEQAKAAPVSYTINASADPVGGSLNLIQLTVRVSWRMPEDATTQPPREVALSTMVYR